jgi:hypothetical protein
VIFVDELQLGRTPWAGGRFSHMISDESVYELRRFARTLGLSWSWYQERSVPHFDLAPRYRARAIRYGATEVDRYGFVAAVRRFRAANPELFRGPG